MKSKVVEINGKLYMTIDELKKKCAELEEKNKQLTDQLCNVANNLLDSWCRNEDDYCPHLDKLEKENAELEKQNEELQKDNEACYKENEGFVKRFNELSEKNRKLQEELNYAETHCLFHGDCPIQEEIVVAKIQVEKMKCLLEKWYKQHSDKTYTKTFYDELIKATEAFLWSDVCVK